MLHSLLRAVLLVLTGAVLTLSPGARADDKKAEDKIEFRAETQIRQGLADTVEWYRSQPAIIRTPL